MPLTAFQKQIFAILKESRNPESYTAGGAAIHKHDGSSRYSNDIDFFHDTDESVVQAYTSDRKILLRNAYTFRPVIEQQSFYRAIIAKEEKTLRLEWVRDTAFRFFPVIEDKELGYRLHDVDLAINKCIALANRSEVRDVLDIIELDKSVLSLAGCCWAACGKDPGFTPDLILEMIQRHANLSPDLLAIESLTKPIDPVSLKKKFSGLLEKTATTLSKLDAKNLGCLFIDDKGRPLKDLNNLNKKLRKHYGTVRGSWPRMVKD